RPGSSEANLTRATIACRDRLAFRRSFSSVFGWRQCAMRMLVLGAGLQGSACAYDLLRQPAVERVTIADLEPERIPGFLAPHVGKRLTPLKLDVPDGAARHAATGGPQRAQHAATAPRHV